MSNRGCVKRYRDKHPTYSVWLSMMKRCAHFKGEKAEVLAWYAGRGITVCEEWRHLRAFEDWCLANGWKKGLEIDRIDNDKGYSPDNCRFVTHRENNLNRRDTVMFGGKPLAHWFDAMGHTEGLTYDAFYVRFTRLHWPICRALFEPVHK